MATISMTFLRTYWGVTKHCIACTPYRNICLGFNWISRKRWIRPMERTGEGAKRPVTRRSRLLVMRCAWCSVSLHRTNWPNLVMSQNTALRECAHHVHRTHRTASRRARRVTGRFASSSVLPFTYSTFPAYFADYSVETQTPSSGCFNYISARCARCTRCARCGVSWHPVHETPHCAHVIWCGELRWGVYSWKWSRGFLTE